MNLDRRGRVKLTERQIEQQIVDALEAHGWRVLRTNLFAGAVIQRQGSVEPGIPDLMARRKFANDFPFVKTGAHTFVAVPGWRIVWIEVKVPGGKPNPKQVAWAAAHPDEEKRIAVCIEDIQDLL